MKSINIKSDAADVVRAVLFSLAIGALLVLIAAMILKFTPIPDSAIMPINIVIKIVSVLVGTFIGFKRKTNGALKGLVSGLITLLLTYFIFAGINGSFVNSGITYIDAIVLIIVAVIAGVLSVNIHSKKSE